MLSILSFLSVIAATSLAAPAFQDSAASGDAGHRVRRQDNYGDGILDPWGKFGEVPEGFGNKKRDTGDSFQDKPSEKRQDSTEDPWEGVLDPWGQFGDVPEGFGNKKRDSVPVSLDDNDDFHINEHLVRAEDMMNHAKRATLRDYHGLIPSCSWDDDPSNPSTGYQSPYNENEGVKIPKMDPNGDDQCTTGHDRHHCWTEYYLVEAAIEYIDWQPTGSTAFCSEEAGSSCGIDVTSLQSSCTTIGTTKSNGWDQKLADVSVGLSVGVEFAGVSMSGEKGYSYSYSKSSSVAETDMLQRCASETATVHCSWKRPDKLTEENKNDDLCHQVFYADRIVHVWGQAQRACSGCDGSGHWRDDSKSCVRGRKGFDFRLPLNKLVYCNGKCNTTDPGKARPPNGDRQKYQPPADWKYVDITPVIQG